MLHRTLVAVVCLLSVAACVQAAPITINFSGVTGRCGAGPSCEDPPFRQDAGRAFTGSFTYDTLTDPIPVTDFSVTFPHSGLTLTATSAQMHIKHHDARDQAVVVRGEFPNGFMTIGLISTELPPRVDLLSSAGITWDCTQWGQCGFRVGIEPPSNQFVFPTGAIIARIADEPHNTLGSLTFQQPVAAIPEPSTFVLVGLGLGALVYLRVRK